MATYAENVLNAIVISDDLSEDEKLLELGKLIEKGVDVQLADNFAIRESSKNGYAKIVNFLIEAGANVHADYDSAIRGASKNGHAEVVKLLKEAGNK